MIRAALGDTEYWDGRIARFQEALNYGLETLREPSKNPAYAPQFWLDHSKQSLRVILLRYSRGDRISELSQYFAGLLDAWELSNRLSAEICAENKLSSCRDWTFDLEDLNHYIWCFWLVGLALTLEIPDSQWQRLLLLIDGEGHDELLDRVIARRQSTRKIGSRILHDKPYRRLLKAIDAPKEQQAALLKDFVEHWYWELNRKGKQQPWWYNYGDPVKHPLEKGSYFGRWCIEAVAAVKAFGIDDGLCLGHEHYPGDLLRPNGPSTHKTRPKIEKNWLTRLLRR